MIGGIRREKEAGILERTQSCCCLAINISVEPNTETRPTCADRCRRSLWCRTGLVWRPCSRSGGFCSLENISRSKRRVNLKMINVCSPRRSSSRSLHGFMNCIDWLISSGVSFTISEKRCVVLVMEKRSVGCLLRIAPQFVVVVCGWQQWATIFQQQHLTVHVQGSHNSILWGRIIVSVIGVFSVLDRN